MINSFRSFDVPVHAARPSQASAYPAPAGAGLVFEEYCGTGCLPPDEYHVADWWCPEVQYEMRHFVHCYTAYCPDLYNPPAWRRVGAKRCASASPSTDHRSRPP